MTQSYIIQRKVIKVHGYQTHVVTAESYIDAVRLLKLGKADLDDEYMEAMELSDICEVILPDDRIPIIIDMCDVEIAESNAKDDRAGEKS